MTSILKHESLGEIHGIQGDDVIQFLGIKYASLANRFSKSELYEHHNVDNGIIDATKLGYIYSQFFSPLSTPSTYYTETNIPSSSSNQIATDRWSRLPSEAATWSSTSFSTPSPSLSSRFPNLTD